MGEDRKGLREFGIGNAEFGIFFLSVLDILAHFSHLEEVIKCRTFGYPVVIIIGIIDKIKAGGRQDSLR
jgi:hypothetical protein